MGKGMAWSVFELESGIDWLVGFLPQLGILFVLPFVIILLKAGRANEFAMVTLFVALFFKPSFSTIFILFVYRL